MMIRRPWNQLQHSIVVWVLLLSSPSWLRNEDKIATAASPVPPISTEPSTIPSTESSAVPSRSQLPSYIVQGPVKLRGNIYGTVTEDRNNNDIGDRYLEGVVVTLYSGESSTDPHALLATRVTDDRGRYLFGDLPAGVYTVRETNLPNYYDVTENEAIVRLQAGQNFRFNFVDEPPKTIKGVVKEDVDDNDTGDVGLEGIIMQLFDDGVLVTTTTTNEKGEFVFENLPPNGKYSVKEVLPKGFINVKDNIKVACPVKHLKKDGVWYEMELTVSSIDPLECDYNDWKNVKNFLQNEMEELQLYHQFNITNLNPRICKRALAPPKRRLQLQHHNGTMEYIDDGDERFDRYLAGGNGGVDIDGILTVLFHLFYRGGGKCFFCWNDNEDSNTRRVLVVNSTLSPETQSPVRLRGSGGNHQQQETLPVLPQYMQQQKRPYSNSLLVSDDEKIDAEDTWMFQDIPGDDDDDGITTLATIDATVNGSSRPANLLNGDDNNDNNNDNNNTSDAPSRGRSRRLMRCGGCYRLNFARDGKNKKITDRRFLAENEYWDSHGVSVRAYPNDGCIAPDDQVRIFNTGDPNEWDLDLGQPNRLCPGGGPGVGTGGEPIMNTGVPNPGMNCLPGANVVILQKEGSQRANDCALGGAIRFYFRFPVTLNRIGLLDMVNSKAATILVYTRDGQKYKHRVNGWGRNSIEDVVLGVGNVKKVIIKMRRSGAIRFIDYCHDCGEEEQHRNEELGKFYPDPAARPFENAASVYHFVDMLPRVNGVISTHLEHEIHYRYRRKKSHCLNGKSLIVRAELTPATPMEASDCKE